MWRVIFSTWASKGRDWSMRHLRISLGDQTRRALLSIPVVIATLNWRWRLSGRTLPCTRPAALPRWKTDIRSCASRYPQTFYRPRRAREFLWGTISNESNLSLWLVLPAKQLHSLPVAADKELGELLADFFFHPAGIPGPAPQAAADSPRTGIFGDLPEAKRPFVAAAVVELRRKRDRRHVSRAKAPLPEPSSHFFHCSDRSHWECLLGRGGEGREVAGGVHLAAMARTRSYPLQKPPHCPLPLLSASTGPRRPTAECEA